ncbi:MAG: phospho-sugar mutase, partial [Chlamydiota bacterium]
MLNEALDPAIEKRIQTWLDGPFDPETKAQIRKLQLSDPKALSDAFFKDLSFGTGGMRGLMGIGTNRMNRYTIGAATQGLANYLKNQPKPEKGYSVFIGYDMRHHSREFAEETARVLSGNGIAVLLSKELCPTPLVSFACRHFGCSAAVMITASHNPPQYNGYKVYWNDGCQIVPPHDVGIMEEVAKIKDPGQIRMGATFQEVGPELDTAYLSELKKLQLHPELTDISLKIIYTNLHGTGLRIIPKALKEWGCKQISIVEKQRSFDGNFPFAPSPNPEEEKALQLGTEQLLAEKGDLLIATDPDADRMGVVALDGLKPFRLTGNQIGCLCLHHICTSLEARREFPPNAAFIKTIVTTELFRQIAESFGGKCIDVLTGFKYIGEQIGLWEKTFDAYQFLFGAEESYGYLFGTFVRDKDAISASCLIAEVASLAKKQNLTLVDRLYQIYRNYGVHRESLTNLKFTDSQAGMEQMESVMHRLRNNPPSQIGGQKVMHLEDYLAGSSKDFKTGKTTELLLPQSDVLR